MMQYISQIEVKPKKSIQLTLPQIWLEGKKIRKNHVETVLLSSSEEEPAPVMKKPEAATQKKRRSVTKKRLTVLFDLY